MKRGTRRLGSFFLGFCAALAPFTGAGCASAPDLSKFTAKPQIELRSVNLDDPSLTAITLVMGLSIKNPNPVDVKLDRIDYALKLDGKDIAQGALDKRVELEAGKTALIEVPVRFNYGDVFETLSALVASGATNYDFKGALKAGPFEIPFQYDGSFKLPDQGKRDSAAK
jgi:LEA14-like dessication related protein